MPQSLSSEQRKQRFKEACEQLETASGRKLRDYQKYGGAQLYTRTRLLLADEPGLGKTVQSILAATALDAKHVIVICPASLQAVWKDEAEVWHGGADNIPYKLSVVSVQSLSYKNRKTGEYDFFRKLVALVEKNPPDVVIVDEAHELKNPDTMRTKCVSGLLKQKCQDTMPRWFLTGSPVKNTPRDMYNLINLLDSAHVASLATSAFDYENKYCHVYMTPFGRKIGKLKKEQTPLLQERLKKWQIRRLKQDVVKELPAKLRSYLPIDVKASELAKFEKRLEEQIIAKSDKKNPEEINELTQLQIHVHAAGLAKIKGVCDWIGYQLDNQVLCFTQHVDVATEITAELNKHLHKDMVVRCMTGKTPIPLRHRYIEDFQGGRINCLVATMACCGLGITLTKANTVLFAEFNWSLAIMEQAMDRAHRIGQERPVSVYFSMCLADGEGTLDAHIAKILATKEYNAQHTLGDIVKEPLI